jgi:predicted histidine transporter YuiF (NhaC family)
MILISKTGNVKILKKQQHKPVHKVQSNHNKNKPKVLLNIEIHRVAHFSANEIA